MSYIEQAASNLANFNKAVISVWFRVPHTSIVNANATNGLIPIVTFGEIFTDAFTTVNNVDSSSYSYTQNVYSTAFTCDLILQSTNTETVTLPLTSVGTHFNLDQCFVGIDCSQLDGLGNPGAYLTVCLQTRDQAVKSGLQWEAVSGSSGTVNAFQGAGALPPGGCSDIIEIDGSEVIAGAVTHTTTDYADITSLVYNRRESFVATSPTIAVSPDKWHHVLLSFDLSGTVAATGSFDGAAPTLSSTCKMWLAFDNVNYTNDDLPRVAADGLGTIGPNDIITDVAFATYFTSYSTPTEQTGVQFVGFATAYQFDATFTGQNTPPSYVLSAPTISAAGKPMGLPSVVETVSNIHHIELAEFQMFTGVTLDTSVENNRRAFINFKLDADGHEVVGDNFLQPVDPTRAIPGAAPGSPPPAQTVIGKAPDILLHGSRNWIAGKNTGTLGQQFSPTGKIKKYKPDPGLPPGPQGSPQ